MALGLTPQQIVESGQHPLLVKAAHWGRVFLKEIASVQNGAAFSSSYFTEDEGLPLIRIRDVGQQETENFYNGPYGPEYIVNSGDLLIGMDGDFRCAFWNGGKAVLNQRVCRVRLKSDLMEEKFLYFCLQPYLDAIHAHTSSVTVKHLSSRTVENIPLPLPPLGEQKRIVAKIEELFSELDDSVANLETARARLQSYRQSLLKHAFEGRLTEQWRRDHVDELEGADQLLQRIREERQARYQQQLEDWKAEVAQWEADGKPGKKPRKPKEPKKQAAPTEEELEDLPVLPSGWSWVRLGEAAEVAGGITKNPKRQSLDNKRPFLRVGNVYANRLEMGEVHEIGVEESELPQVSLEDGDLLVVEGNGSVDQIGRVAVWDGRVPGAVHQNHLIRARPTSLLRSFFALWFRLSKQGRDHIMRVASSTSGLHTLSLSKVENLLVPICSVQEQELVVEELEVKLGEMEEAEKTIENSLQQMQLLRQCILKCAFEGRLVAQSEDDEPAADLLTRIHGQEQGAKEEKA